MINDVAIELKLPKNLRNVHPDFHHSLLKRAPTPDKWHPLPAYPLPILVYGEQHQEVEDILDSKIGHKKLYYLIKWLHFGVGEIE